MSTRRIPASAFRNDDGRADVALAAALTAFGTEPARRPEVLAALHTARVLAPVVAVVGDTETTSAGLRTEKTSDIAVPLLEGTDGRRALPVFSDSTSLARWDPAARPVPVDGPGAAQVVAEEGAEVLVLDPAGPVTCVLAAPELRALVGGAGTVPAYDDDVLAAQVAEVVANQPAVLSAWLLPQLDADARLALRLVDGVDGANTATVVLQRVAAQLREQPDWARLAVRGIDLAVLPPDETPERPPVFRRFLD